MTAGWREQAACRGKPVEWFFPARVGSNSYDQGKAVCAGCPVQVECHLEHARAQRETGRDLPGLWGGEVKGREARMALRRATKVTCVVCGTRFKDKCATPSPKYCSMPCYVEASRVKRGLVERSYPQPSTGRPQSLLGCGPSDPQHPRPRIASMQFDEEAG